MKTSVILSIIALLGTSILSSCSGGGSANANVRGGGIGSLGASVGGSGSVSRNRR